MGYYLIYGDGTPESYGPVSTPTQQNYNASANAHPVPLSSKTGTFHVVANMKSTGTGSTFAHRLTTTAPTTP